MSLYVKKFGGTSVGTIERIEHVADLVKASRDQGDDVVVVVSAMSGETNRLIDLAKQVMPKPTPRELDVLMSTGEQVTIALLAMALEKRGCPARSYTGGQVAVQTDETHNKARIKNVGRERIDSDLAAGRVVVVAGFQGVDAAGNITTLGRGGSDTSAVALAAALKADECQIFTDVDGIYTTDPRIEPRARRLDRITFEEMLELASLGAKVLQIRSVEFAGKYNVPLRVLSSFQENAGTLITYEEPEMEDAVISGIAFNRDEAQIRVAGAPDQPGIARRIIGAVSDANIEVDMILQNVASDGGTANFTFTVHRNDYQQALELVRGITEEIGAERVDGDESIVKISLVGVGMRSHAGIATRMFEALGNEGINIHMISTSEIKISVVVDEKYLELGVRALHAAFGLDAPPKAVGELN
ncbi:aspartate kinase [Halofilum ochraceum]|uniref:aspartate kinase n=1 Tax=Halofilum ochraceum TaxID=1611323 RepID=UPI0008DAB12C|nr:aspartate kinase [Halofilum ochraceum]